MSLFFYVTYKLVLLKDKRLGVLYYVLAVLALLYTLVEIFIRKGYMDVSLWYCCMIVSTRPWYQSSNLYFCVMKRHLILSNKAVFCLF